MRTDEERTQERLVEKVRHRTRGERYVVRSASRTLTGVADNPTAAAVEIARALCREAIAALDAIEQELQLAELT